jgi:phosphoglycerol transferase MdoB-like AlkP superfamily enzyme
MQFKPVFRKKTLTKQLIISFAVIFCLMLVYSLLRLGFCLSNMSFFSGTSSRDIFFPFINGLRFDLAAVFITNAPILLLYNFPYAPVERKWYKIILLILFFFINLTALITNIGDYGYFAATQRRLMYEPYTMFPDIMRMIPSAIGFHYDLLLIFIIGAVVFIYIFTNLGRRLDRKIALKRAPAKEILNFFLIVLISIVAIRGGFQLKPLRQANAFTSDSQALGYLTLNTTYNVVRSMFQPLLPDISLMPKNEAAKYVLEMIKDDNETLLDSQFIFMREKHFNTKPQKLNVVIFIMESWSAKYSGAITNSKSCMPFFDSLASHGMLFTNFFANGQRSIEAIPSILTSVPSIYNASIIGSIAEMDRFRGLGSILNEQGYTTSFHHGASVGSMGFDGFSKIAGFTNYYGKEDFPNLPSQTFDGAWGIFDEPFFMETERIINSYKEPFCSVTFSLSSHDPYKIPDDRLTLFEQYKDETDFERSIRYSDNCLGKFFQKASSEPWFNNTLFIITADHTLYSTRDNFYSCFHVPMLLFTPSGLIPAAKIDVNISHADIVPTLLDILKIPAVHSSMGLSAFSPKKERYCFEKYGNDYCIIGSELVLLNDLENPPKLFNYRTDPSLKNNLASQRPDAVSDMNAKLLSYIEATTNSISKDRIYTEKKQ